MKKDPRAMLSVYPSIELDAFVFSDVIEVPLDGDWAVMPSVSQTFSACNVVVSYVLSNYGDITISVSENYFEDAVKKKFLLNKRPCKVYKITCGAIEAYGRSFAESICKLAICLKYNLKIGDENGSGNAI